MSTGINRVCWIEVPEQLGPHRYAVITHPDEFVPEPPHKKIPGSAYGYVLESQ